MSRFLEFKKRWSKFYNHVRLSNFRSSPSTSYCHFSGGSNDSESNGAFDRDSRARESQENKELRFSASAAIGSCFPALERLNLSEGAFCCIANFLKRNCDLRAARLSVTVRRPPRQPRMTFVEAHSPPCFIMPVISSSFILACLALFSVISYSFFAAVLPDIVLLIVVSCKDHACLQHSVVQLKGWLASQIHPLLSTRSTFYCVQRQSYLPVQGQRHLVFPKGSGPVEQSLSQRQNLYWGQNMLPPAKLLRACEIYLWEDGQ